MFVPLIPPIGASPRSPTSGPGRSPTTNSAVNQTATTIDTNSHNSSDNHNQVNSHNHLDSHNTTDTHTTTTTDSNNHLELASHNTDTTTDSHDVTLDHAYHA